MNKIILFFLFSTSLSAQIKGVVKDSITKEPIPFVALFYENTEIGTNANEKGEFELKFYNNKFKLKVSCLGYYSKTLKLENLNEIFLSPNTKEIQIVEIQNKKQTSEIVIGDYKNIELITGFTNSGKEVPYILAKLIRYNDKIKAHPFIKSIEFPTDSDLNNVLLKIRIFNVDNEGNPSTNLLFDEVIVNINKGKKNNFVDLSQYNIIIPNTGIIIGFEYLILEQNKHQYYHINNGIKSKTFSYEPTILSFYGNTYSTLFLNLDGSYKNEFNIHQSVEIPIKLTLTN